MEYYRDKKTQGCKKMFQYVEDLKRNKHFLRDWKKYKESLKSINSDDFWAGFDLAVKEYEKLNKKTQKFINKYQGDIEKITKKMAENYRLDANLLHYIDFSFHKELNKSNLYEDYLDMCVYKDDYDERFGYSTLPYLPLLLDPDYKNHLRVYPISIDIHQFASKRDVLDFVEKRWERIYTNNLGPYTDYEKVRIRTRKLNQEITDFIWNNKNLKAKEIKELLNKKFPNNNLVYYEIHKIIAIEKIRRNE